MSRRRKCGGDGGRAVAADEVATIVRDRGKGRERTASGATGVLVRQHIFHPLPSESTGDLVAQRRNETARHVSSARVKLVPFPVLHSMVNLFSVACAVFSGLTSRPHPALPWPGFRITSLRAWCGVIYTLPSCFSPVSFAGLKLRPSDAW